MLIRRYAPTWRATRLTLQCRICLFLGFISTCFVSVRYLPYSNNNNNNIPIGQLDSRNGWKSSLNFNGKCRFPSWVIKLKSCEFKSIQTLIIPHTSLSPGRRGYRVVYKISRMRSLSKHRQNPRWRFFLAVTSRHCCRVYKVLFALTSWKMQNRRSLHQTLQQRVYGGFPPGALLKRARGMWFFDWSLRHDERSLTICWSLWYFSCFLNRIWL